MPYLVSKMNFANLSMMCPCHCYLIFLSPVHHHHYHYASLHHCSTPDSKLTFFINPIHHSSPAPFRTDLTDFVTIFGLIAHRFFLCFAVFIFHRVID